jgi:hypothetical protein
MVLEPQVRFFQALIPGPAFVFVLTGIDFQLLVVFVVWGVYRLSHCMDVPLASRNGLRSHAKKATLSITLIGEIFSSDLCFESSLEATIQ